MINKQRNSIKKSFIWFFISTIIIGLTSCYSYKTIPIPNNEINPTSFIFNMPIEQIHQIIITNFGGFSISTDMDLMTRHFEIFIKDDKRLLPSMEEYYKIEENHYDIFLNTNSSFQPFIDYSNVYTKHNKALPLTARDIRLHLDSIGINKTKIEISIRNLRAVTGYFWLKIPHEMPVEKDVVSTTIEEYKILQRIGLLVHENNMPLLV